MSYFVWAAENNGKSISIQFDIGKYKLAKEIIDFTCTQKAAYIQSNYCENSKIRLAFPKFLRILLSLNTEFKNQNEKRPIFENYQ